MQKNESFFKNKDKIFSNQSDSCSSKNYFTGEKKGIKVSEGVRKNFFGTGKFTNGKIGNHAEQSIKKTRNVCGKDKKEKNDTQRF